MRSMLVAVTLIAACAAACSRWTVLPADPTPACALDGTTANTAPGFNLPAGHARVFVLESRVATPAQQKLEAELLGVVREQGGVMVDDPLKADLLVSAETEEFTVEQQEVKYATATSHSFGSFSFSMVGGRGGWGLSESSTVSRVPLVMTKHEKVTKLQIDVFQHAAADPKKLRQVWRAELQAGYVAFHETPHECVEALFRRIGGPDGVF